MSSRSERALALPKIEVEAGKEHLLQVVVNGKVVWQEIMIINQVDFNAKTGKSNVKIELLSI